MRPECLEQFVDILDRRLDKRKYRLIDFFETKIDPNNDLCFCNSVLDRHLCPRIDGHPNDANTGSKSHPSPPRDGATST